MSLLEASDARKTRLAALRKRKAGEDAGEEYSPLLCSNPRANVTRRTGIIKARNFDPETRTLRKHAAMDEDMPDTVEKDVAGLAEQIMAEDEQRRQQELVITPRFSSLLYPAHLQSGRI
jgi:coiled-coil domain-containing protein 12